MKAVSGGATAAWREKTALRGLFSAVVRHVEAADFQLRQRSVFLRLKSGVISDSCQGLVMLRHACAQPVDFFDRLKMSFFSGKDTPP